MFLSRVSKKGLTLTELLVVLAIIGLIATIAIPSYLNRIEQARKTTAQAECEAIAKAEEIVGATYGYYIPIQCLDNVPNTSGTSTVPDDDWDNEDLTGRTLYAIDLSIPVASQVGNQGTGGYDLVLSENSNNTRIKNMITNWSGPFFYPQRYYKGTDNNPYPTNASTVRLDHPLDPWGRPYRFFSPVGIIGSNADGTNYDTDTFSNGSLTTTSDRFDRFAIVSLGGDGLLDSTGSSQTKDDIYYVFGPGETVYNP